MSQTGRKAAAAGPLLAGLLVLGLLSAERPPQAQAGGYLNGVDVSHWDGSINWTSVKNSGRTFAFAKATEGLTFTDPQFATNWRNMQPAGILRGAYHFCHPRDDPIAQANFFYNTVQPTSGDLWLAGDLEVTDGLDPATIQDWGHTFVHQIKQLTGKPGFIYTGYYFWRDQVGNPTTSLNCPLWIAAYGVSQPHVPDAWTTWTFWQYSDTGRVPGISGSNTDLDYFNGTLSQLLALTYP